MQRAVIVAAAAGAEAAQDHLPGRARSTADLTLALPTSAARRSPRPEEFCRLTPLARKRPTKMVPSPPTLTSPITGVAVAKPTPAPGRGRAITGRLKRIPMFAQVSSYRKHCPQARGEFCRPTPSRARGRQNGPSPPALTSPITGVQVAKPTTAPDRGRAITGRLKQIPMFAQVSFYRKHRARARDRVQQPVRADRRRLPPAELTRSGRCGPGLGRPGHARR